METSTQLQKLETPKLLIFKITVEELYKTINHYDTYDNDDGMTSIGGKQYISDKEQRRNGSRINIKSLGEDQESLEQYLLKRKELEQTFKDGKTFGIELTFPKTLTLELQDINNLGYQQIAENLSKKEFYLQIHTGIKGHYINRVSDIKKYSITEHEKYRKYGFNKPILSTPLDYEQYLERLPFVESFIFSLYPQLTLDTRYAFNGQYAKNANITDDNNVIYMTKESTDEVSTDDRTIQDLLNKYKK